MSKRLDGNMGYQGKTSSWHLIGFPDGSKHWVSCPYSLSFKRFDILTFPSPLMSGCSIMLTLILILIEGLDAFRFLFMKIRFCQESNSRLRTIYVC